jgi:hypothetical protein
LPSLFLPGLIYTLPFILLPFVLFLFSERSEH